MLAALRLPGVQRLTMVPHGQPEQAWLFGGDGSWACREGPDVRQGGPRRLWDQLEALYGEWSECGRPARHEIGLTVTVSGEHRIWTGRLVRQARRLDLTSNARPTCRRR